MAGRGVHIGSVQALRDFKERYRLFASAVSDELQRIGEALRYRIAQVEQAYIRQQGRVEALRRRCQEARPQNEVGEYWTELKKAEELLNQMAQALQRVRRQEALYRQAVQSVRQLAERGAQKALTFLEGCISDIEKYMSLSPPAGLEATVSAAPAGTSSERASVPEESAREKCPVCKGQGWVRRVPFNPERFEYWANPDHKEPCPRCGGVGVLVKKGQKSVKGSLPQTAGVQEDNPGDLTGYRLPQGFQWVPLEAIALEDADLEFRKVDKRSMEEGLKKLPEVIKLLQDRLEETFAENGAYFFSLDQQAGVSYPSGLLRVYETFFGSEPIRLSRFKGAPQWTVENGRHRILVAKELGWKALPAQAIEVER